MADKMQKYKRIAAEREEEAKVVRAGGMYPAEQREADKEARREAAKNHKKVKKADRMENLFKELNDMSNDDMDKRLEEIDTRIKETEERRKDIYKAVKGITSKEGIDNKREKVVSLNNEFESLKKEAADLKKEKEKIELFPKIKKQIVRIRNLRDKTIEDKKANFKKAKLELKEAKAQLKEKEKDIKDIDIESKKIEDYQKKFAKDADILDQDREDYIASIKRLEFLRENTKKDAPVVEELKNKVTELSEKVKTYELGKSVEDSVINKCNMAWKMLLAGRTWDEIMLANVENVKDRQVRAKEEEKKFEIELDEESKKLEDREPAAKVKEAAKNDAKTNLNETIYTPEMNIDEKEERVPKYQSKFAKKEESEKEPEEHNEEVREEVKSDEESEIEEAEYEVVKWGDPSKALVKRSFAERHPRLAKIPFLAKIMDKIAERKENKKAKLEGDVPEKSTSEKIGDTSEEKPQEIMSQRDAFMEYLKEYANKEDGDRKEFGGLEVEKKALKKVSKEDLEKVERKYKNPEENSR